MNPNPADQFKVTVRTGIDYDTGAIGMSVHTPWDLASQTATRIMETQERATREALIALGWTPPGEAQGWIVANGEGTQWRTWGVCGSEWTRDREAATRYHRREDAEAVHGCDEDAWHVVPYGEAA